MLIKMKPKCYQLIGVPGSGKSTWYKNNEKSLGTTMLISTDEFVEREAQRQNKTYSEIFKDYMPTAVKLMARLVKTAKDLHFDIVWDQTSTTIESRKKKFRMLPEYEHIAVVFKTPPKAELEKRLQSRPGKVIPPEVMYQMISGMQMPTKEEGFSKIIII